ncbi:hypothetical protein CORC01_05987 [Colletotrichum orchidophilum]|uniref:Uncharacterized protein n=1 Tax=Colletotrichum orchidophilum TaxID=1209926 RepID=A0A1G4BBD0_9PEZI|nr:uncharacterized protein CORC01_05987 [Colletotrichum orchidophilum]OHE98721.1 hypothetical protein CORC01_05987 [Colletotrichum orchidophilum]
MQPISGARKIMEQEICRFLGRHRFLSLQGLLALDASALAGAFLDLSTSTHVILQENTAQSRFCVVRSRLSCGKGPLWAERKAVYRVSPTHYRASDTSPGPERPRLGPLFFPAGWDLRIARVTQPTRRSISCLDQWFSISAALWLHLLLEAVRLFGF